MKDTKSRVVHVKYACKLANYCLTEGKDILIGIGL